MTWYRIENATGDTGARVPVIRLFDEIGGWWGPTADEFARELDALGDDFDELQLRVNSPGGDVFDGLAIMNTLRAHRATVTTYVDGMAASAASFIVAGGSDVIVMNPGTELMIHNPSAITRGDAATHRDSAARLDQIAASIAAIYRGRAGGELADWIAAMAAETWYSAEEAVTAGLADRVDAMTPPEPVTNRRYLPIFNFAGRAHAPAPRPPAAPAAGPTRTERSGSMPTLLESLCRRLGISADADEGTALEALDEVLAEQAEDDTEDETETETETSADGSVQLPDGVVAVDRSVLEQLQARAQRGDEARTRQEREDRERLVENAIRTGRVTPARRAHWLAQLEADPAVADTLAALQPVYPVGPEIGHAGDGGGQTAAAGDGWFAQFPTTRKEG